MDLASPDNARPSPAPAHLAPWPPTPAEPARPWAPRGHLEVTAHGTAPRSSGGCRLPSAVIAWTSVGRGRGGWLHCPQLSGAPSSPLGPGVWALECGSVDRDTPSDSPLHSRAYGWSVPGAAWALAAAVPTPMGRRKEVGLPLSVVFRYMLGPGWASPWGGWP